MNLGRRFRFRRAGMLGAASLAALIMGQACTGGFEGMTTSLTQSSSGDSTPAGSTDEATAIDIPAVPQIDCASPGMRGAGKPGVRRLNKLELINNLKDLVKWYDPELEELIGNYSDVVDMTEASSFTQYYSAEQNLKWALIVDNVAELIASDRPGFNARYNFGGECFKAAQITDACWTNFFTTIGKRAYRRSLTSDEVTGLTKSVAALPANEGVYRAITTLLRSPDFLFHIESGVREEDNRVRLSSQEVANRISFAILGRRPDAALQAAADANQIESVAAVEDHARRLLAMPAAQTKLGQFFSDWLQYDRMAPPDYTLTDLGSKFTYTPRELAAETTDYLNDVFWGRPGNFKDLMTSTRVFPRSNGLKLAYGTAGFDQAGKMAYDSPDHPGLITRIGLLSQQGQYTSPIKRGVFVKRRILCDYLPTPDFSVVALRLDELGALSGFDRANHQMVTQRTSASACIGCHSQINPIGFSLEGYDVFGTRRTREAFVDWSNAYGNPKVPYYGQQYHGALHDLPYPVAGVNLGGAGPITVNQPSDLTTALGTSDRAAQCLATFVVQHFERRENQSGDACAIKEAAAALQKGVPVVDVFVRMLANEDIFWRTK